MNNRKWITLGKEEEGSAMATVMKHRDQPIYLVSLADYLDEYLDEDAIEPHRASARVLRQLEAYDPKKVVWDFSQLKAVGLTAMAEIQDTHRRLSRSACLSAMVLNPGLCPQTAFSKLVSYFHQEPNLDEAVRWLLSHSQHQPSKKRPSWDQVAGLLFGAATLLFIIIVTFFSLFNHPIPTSGRFPVLAALALGAALSTGLLGSSAAAQGTVMVPVLKSPVKIGVAGIAAILVVLLLIGWIALS
jgi:hypothetical protein